MPAERARLDAAFRATLARGVHGLCFSPYLEGQQPGDTMSEAQIRARLAVVRPHTRWVRSFSCTDGHEQTPRIAKELGLKTLVGAWLGLDAAINERELEGVIAVARAGHADVVAVGNEVLLREDLGEDELIAHIERVKRALPGVPVGYVDAYFLFEKHPRVTAVCDVVMTNCYPFWEGCPREQALPYMQAMLAKHTRGRAGQARAHQRDRLARPGQRLPGRRALARGGHAVLRRHRGLGRGRGHRVVPLRGLRRGLEGRRRGRCGRLLGPVGQGRKTQVRLTVRHSVRPSPAS
jgi:hypothetical protein